MLCCYYSMLAYNEWIIVSVLVSDGTEEQSMMTMMTFKEKIESVSIRKPKLPT